MKAIDLRSVLVAGVMGAFALFAIETLMSPAPLTSAQVTQQATIGFGVGVMVQIGVRLTGVS